MEGVTRASGCGEADRSDRPRGEGPGRGAAASSTRAHLTSACREHRLIAACETCSCGAPPASVTSACWLR